MRSRGIPGTIGIALVVAAAAWSGARAANTNARTADITLGAHVAGPAVGPEDLVGRVVVLEFWGIHCGPCIASMPGLEELHERFGPQGLAVIGAHVQGGSADEVRAAVKNLGVTFTIVDGAFVNGGMGHGGIPHCMVFDHTGACIYSGSPGEAHDVVATAMEAAPAAVLAGRTLVKLEALGKMLRNEAAWGNVLKMARSLLDSPDPETADEARFVVERIERRGGEMLEQARGLADRDPAAALALARRCAAAFRGSDVGADAGEMLREWNKDKAFQSALKLGHQIERLEAIRAAAAGGPIPPQVRSQAREIAKAVESGWPGSAAAARAAAIAAELDSRAAPP